VNSALISGLLNPIGIAISGTNLFVANFGNGNANTGKIGEYTISGTTVNASLISGLDNPWGITVVPEPNVLLLFALGVMQFPARRR
jgi:DNA-binding beta-propeller fold protein YncE